MPDLFSIGNKFSVTRNAAGLSQKALAEKIGTTQCLIDEYEKVKKSMSVIRLMEIVEVLGVSTAGLVE